MSEKTNDLPSVGTEDARSLAELLKCGMGCGPTERKAATMLRALVSERDELASRVRELETEVLDQCRLNGMGAERESALMGRVRELESAALAAQPGAVGEPYAYAVYFPDQPTEELVHDLDELLDDMTNREHTVTALFAAAPTEAKPAQDAVDADDPLQGAVDWLLQADGEFFCVATVQRTLRIGYNRANRLSEVAKERAAISAKKGGAA